MQTVTILLLFRFRSLLFPFLLWLLWLKLPKLCWIIVVRVGKLILFLILLEMFQFFTTENDVGCEFVMYVLYYVKVIEYAYFPESFYHKWVLNFVKSFICIYWDYHMVFSFNLLIWCITLIDLCMLKTPCIHGINLTWSCFMILLMCCWILFASILLRISACMVISGIGL